MGKEHFIKGKQDASRHEGRRAQRRREEEANCSLKQLWPELIEAAEAGTLDDEADFHPVKIGGLTKSLKDE